MRKLSLVFLTGVLSIALGCNAFAATTKPAANLADAKKTMVKPAAKLHEKHQAVQHKKVDEKK